MHAIDDLCTNCSLSHRLVFFHDTRWDFDASPAHALSSSLQETICVIFLYALKALTVLCCIGVRQGTEDQILRVQANPEERRKDQDCMGYSL